MNPRTPQQIFRGAQTPPAPNPPSTEIELPPKEEWGTLTISQAAAQLAHESKANNSEFGVWFAQRMIEDNNALKSKLFDTSIQMSAEADKMILWLAAGSFGASASFLPELVPEPREGTLEMMLGAWLCFAVSLIATFWSFRVSEEAIKVDVFKLDKSFAEMMEPNMLSWVVGVLNLLGGVTLTVGILLTVRYVWINI